MNRKSQPDTTGTKKTRSDSEQVGMMVDYLEELLIKQLDRLKNYDLDAALAIAEEADKLERQMHSTGIANSPEFARKCVSIQKLYREICLVIASERQEVADKLRNIRSGIKTLETYIKSS